MTEILNRLFPPPRPQTRTRPDDLLYGVDETPPRSLTLAMGAQHAFLALMFTVYSVLVAQSIGLSPRAATAFISASILLMGVGTLLQSFRSRFGAGMLLVIGPAPGRVPVFIAVTTQYGLGASMGGVIVAGLVTMLAARFLPRLRALLPPEVIGVVVLMLGLSLVATGVSRSVGFAQDGTFAATALATAATTLVSIIAVTLWGPPWLRRLAILFGTAAGTIVAAATGAFRPGSADLLLEMPPLALPVLGLDLPRPEFMLVPIAVILVSQLAAIMDQFASALSLDKMNDAHWRRADMPMVARAVSGLGMMHVLHGCLGLLHCAPSSANIGLAHASGITARKVGIAAGLILMAAAFVPPLAGVIVLTPSAVIGGILMYTASYMIVSGMELSTSRMMNNRRSLTVGLSISCGVAVMVLPALGELGPDWSRIILHSGLTVGSIAAVAINGVLRIGVRQKMSTTLDPGREAAEAAEFLEKNGQAWGARRDVVARAGIVIGEAIEAIRQAGVAGPMRLTASFDEFNLRCRLRYAGKALIIDPDVILDPMTLLEEDDDAIDAAMRKVSGLLIARMADRVRVKQQGETAEVTLSFDH